MRIGIVGLLVVGSMSSMTLGTHCVPDDNRLEIQLGNHGSDICRDSVDHVELNIGQSCRQVEGTVGPHERAKEHSLERNKKESDIKVCCLSQRMKNDG